MVLIQFDYRYCLVKNLEVVIYAWDAIIIRHAPLKVAVKY